MRFSDFQRLLEGFGWTLDRQEGSHQVYRHPSVPERLSVQPDRNGQAKPYQIRRRQAGFGKWAPTHDLISAAWM
ncbi:MAG: type II toxin-antitoxin system HicA family toxin [Actinomycetota bacterium]